MPSLNAILKVSTFSDKFKTQIFPRIDYLFAEELQKKAWKIEGGIVVNWIEVFEQMESTLCYELEMTKSKLMLPRLIPSLSRINFSDMRRLLLINMSIANIEALAFMDIQNLELLDISENHIINIKPIEKQNWPQLQEINIWSNKCLKEVYLYRIKIDETQKMMGISYGMWNMEQLQSLKIYIEGTIQLNIFL